MGKTLQVAKHEFTHMVKTKGFIIVTLLFPVLSLAVIGGYQIIQGIGAKEATAEVVSIGFVDQSGGFDDTSQTGDIEFIQYQSAEEATNALTAGDIEEYFIIAPDYISTGRIDRFTLEREMETPSRTNYAVRNFLLDNLLQGQLSDEIVERTKSPVWFNSTRLDKTGQVSPEQGGVLSVFLVPYIFSILFWIAVISASFTLIEGLGEEKENRIMEILLSSISARQLILGKIIGLGIGGLLQVIIWFVSASYIAGLASTSIGGLFSTLEIPIRLMAFGIVYFILGYLMFAVLYACIGAIVPNYREGQQLSFFIIMPGVMPLMLIYFLVEHPDHIVTNIFTYLPITAPITAIIRLALGSMSPWQITLSIILLVLSAAGLFLLGTRLFRAFLLMYGKRPGFREIVRSLRQA